MPSVTFAPTQSLSVHCLSKKIMGNAKMHLLPRGCLEAFSTAHPASRSHISLSSSLVMYSKPQTAERISQRISEAGALTLYQNEKRFEVAKFFTKQNGLSLPYRT